MAEEASKGISSKIAGKVGDKFTDKLIDKALEWVVTLVVGGAALGFIRNEWACIRKPVCEVPGWLHGALVAAAAVAIIAAFFLGRAWFRARRDLREVKAQRAQTKPASPLPRALFQPFDVEDQKLNLRWSIRRPPHEWLNIDITNSPAYIEQLVDGPFHAKDGCSARVKVLPDQSPSGNHPPTFDEHCPHCGDRIFMTPVFSDVRRVAVPPVRAEVLEELQRMARNGTSLEGRDALDPPIVLEKPGYWKRMLPPPTDAKP